MGSIWAMGIVMKHYFQTLILVHLYLKSPIPFENSFGRDLGTPSSMLGVVACAVCMLYEAVCCRLFVVVIRVVKKSILFEKIHLD